MSLKPAAEEQYVSFFEADTQAIIMNDKLTALKVAEWHYAGEAIMNVVVIKMWCAVATRERCGCPNTAAVGTRVRKSIL